MHNTYTWLYFLDETDLLAFLKTQEVIHDFPTKHKDECMWVEIRENEVVFIAETGLEYKLEKHYISPVKERLVSEAIGNGQEKLFMPYCRGIVYERLVYAVHVHDLSAE